VQKSALRSSFLSLPGAFAATLLLSALLLFSVQPLAGKLLLPLLGGSPAVWNTAMVFFQAMLLAGYAYAHWSYRWLGPKYQPLVHVGLLILAGFQLPFGISGSADQAHPALWLLGTLLGSIGLPVFVLAATAPLLQKWFALTAHPSARDPYFLYAASNAGSFAALFAYPLLIEPFLRLKEQARWWSGGFWLLALAIACCWLLIRKGEPVAEAEVAAPVKRLTAWKWIGLALVPSSLMLGVTNYITTDIASVPLLWVLPLALYLLTFVIAFGKQTGKAGLVSGRAIPILALAVVFPMLVQATEPVFVLVLLHLVFFFFAALQCHLKLARSRPPATQLTQYYLFLSIGGVLGGITNALLAPILFDSILEYPLMILAATLIGFPERTHRQQKFRVPPIYGGAIILLATSLGAAFVIMAAERSVLLANLLAGALLLTAFLLIRTPVRYTLAIASLLASTSIFRGAQNQVLDRDRNFFGVVRVTEEPGPRLRKLYHGTTIHGVQSTDPEKSCQPLSYYHSAGPVAEAIRLYSAAKLPPKVALVGLGAGAMITYSKPGEEWVLYEIDPAVVRMARDTNYFTYLSLCSQGEYRIELGDARVNLENAPDQSFGLLFIDAFSSDVIPMHLLTRQAVQLYRRKLAPGGILAFHLSSRNFELEPLIANIGEAEGLYCFSSTKGELGASATREGGLDSNWAILVEPSLLHHVVGQGTWQRLRAEPSGPLWTDDFSSLLGVLQL
jgi:SAM-dependent methyltransferase